MNAADGTTIIGKSVKIYGDLSGSEDLVMDGEIQGTIQLPGARLTVGVSARCRADIVAQDVVVYGRLEGDIRARGRVELRGAAMVQGNIYAGGLSIEDGVAFRGLVDPSRSGEALPSAAPAPVATSEPAKPAPMPTPIPMRPASHLPAALAAVAARPMAVQQEDPDQPESVSLFNEN